MLITRDNAVLSVIQHGLNPDDFFSDCGDREEYEGREILDWLATKFGGSS